MELQASTLQQEIDKCFELGESIRIRDEVFYAPSPTKNKKALQDRIESDICYARLATKKEFYFITSLPDEVVSWYMQEVVSLFPEGFWERMTITPITDKDEEATLLNQTKFSIRYIKEPRFVLKPLFKVEFTKPMNKSSAFIALNLFRMLHENQDIALLMHFMHTKLPKLPFDVLYVMACSVAGRSSHLIGSFYFAPQTVKAVLKFSFKKCWEEGMPEFERLGTVKYDSVDDFFMLEERLHAEARFYRYLDKAQQIQVLETLIEKGT